MTDALPRPRAGRPSRRGRGSAFPPLAGQDAALVAAHLEHMRLRGLSPATIYKRQRDLTRLAAWLGAPLADATPGQLACWRAALATGTEATLASISSTSRFYAWLAEQDIRADNPAARLARPRRGRRLPRPIGETDLSRALETAPPAIRVMLVLAGWAGLRAKEIALLRRENILDEMTPPVLLIAADATKGRSERIVPLSPFALAELRGYGLPASGWLLARGDGRPGPNTPARVSQLANRWLHGHGITATLHQLRHRFGTQAYRAGRDLRAVQELMGHADPATTAGYAAFDVAAATAAVNAIPPPAPTSASSNSAPRPGRRRGDGACRPMRGLVRRPCQTLNFSRVISRFGR